MDSYGTITVYAYSSNARIPVEGATVVISRGDGNSAQILATARTDRSGYITPVMVPAPNPSQSLSPDQSTPFSTVFIKISHPDYETEKIGGVQIFPNVITVQSFRMIPVNPQYSNGEELEYDTPSQDL